MKLLPLLIYTVLNWLAGLQKPNKAEGVVLAKINNLPEVKSFIKSHHREKAFSMIDSSPDTKFNYYWIKVGTSNFNQFRTNFDFLVDPKCFEVYYYDTYTESGPRKITLQRWRQWRITPAWKKMHVYKGGQLFIGLKSDKK